MSSVSLFTPYLAWLFLVIFLRKKCTYVGIHRYINNYQHYQIYTVAWFIFLSVYKAYWSSQKVLVCLSSPFFPCFLGRCLGAREMSQQLKACTPLSEDPSLIFNRTLGSFQLPRTSSLPGNLTASPGLCDTCVWAHKYKYWMTVERHHMKFMGYC